MNVDVFNILNYTLNALMSRVIQSANPLIIAIFK